MSSFLKSLSNKQQLLSLHIDVLMGSGTGVGIFFSYFSFVSSSSAKNFTYI